MPTTVQLAGTKTFWYFSVADTRLTSVKPRDFSLFSAIFAFSPVRSGTVIGPDTTEVVVSGEEATDEGALAVHDGILDCDCVTVTVAGGLAVLPPQAATVSATANAPVAIEAVLLFTVEERITSYCPVEFDCENMQLAKLPTHTFGLPVQ
jgi:hypothetical protein